MQQRRSGIQLILAGVILVVLVLLAALFLLNRGGSTPKGTNAPVTTSPVVVALQAIPQGTVLHSTDNLDAFFAVRQAPPNLVPFGAYTSVHQITSLLQSSGCATSGVTGCQSALTTTQTIFQNTPVVTGMFSSLGQFRQTAGASFVIPYGYVGVAISFDPINSVLGSISAGDDIDIIASYHGQHIPGLHAPPQTQYVLNDMRVVSVNAPPAPAATGSTPAPSSGSNGTAAAAGGTLILLARYQEALIIQHLKDFGWQMSAVLRSAKETDIPHFKTTPVTDRWFFVKTSNPLQENPGY